MKKNLGLALVVMMATQIAKAQDADAPADSTRVKAENVLPDSEKNKPTSGDDADDVLTNKQMRAQSGSKSKWSFGSVTKLMGGSIERPVAEERPNITGGSQSTPRKTDLESIIGIAYKATATDRISLDVGVRWLTPFSSSTPSSDGRSYSKFDASNPDIMYRKIFSWGPGIQSQIQTGPTLITNSDLRSVGNTVMYQVISNNVVELGHSGFSLGAYFEVDYNWFDKFDAESEANSNDWYYEADPFFEYVLNDTFNLRAVTIVAAYERDRNNIPMAYSHYPYIQSFGVGISVTRDVFLYPNVQFRPISFNDIINADRTNIGIEADINLF